MQQESFQHHQQQILTQILQIKLQGLNINNTKCLIKLLKNVDVSYLYLFIEMGLQYFQNVLQFWNKYRLQYKNYISQYMDVLYSKILRSQVSSYLYQLQPFKELYQKVTKSKARLLAQSQLQSYDSDTKLKMYKNQLQKQSNNESIQNKNNELNLGKQGQKQFYHNDNMKHFGNNSNVVKIDNLRQLYFKEELQFEQQSILNKKIGMDPLVYKKIKQNIQQMPTLSRDCYGCMSFVYQDQDLTFSTAKQQISFMGSMSKIKQYQIQVIKRLVGYLNGRGGVIILGTKLNGHKIVPLIQLIAQYQKQQHLNRIQGFVSSLSHNVSLSKHIQISFIPIAKKINDISSTQNKQKTWIKGGYIMRILITPIQPHYTYYYQITKQQKLQQIIFSKQTELGLFQLKNEKIYEFLKERFKEYQPSKITPQFPLKLRGNYYPSLVFHYNACKNVESGDMYHGEQKYYKVETVVETKVNPLMKNRQNYKKITLLVCVAHLKERILKMFKQMDKMQVQIDDAFPQFDFRLSNNTFLIFHNCKFQKLKTCLNKDKLNLKQANDKKQVLLISTQQIIKIESKYMTKARKEEIENVIKDTVSKQSKLIFHQRIIQKTKDKKEIELTYIKCQSNITAIFLYFYLNHQNIKSIFDRLPQSGDDNINRNKSFKESPFKDKQRNNISDYKNRGGNYSKNYHYDEYEDQEDQDYDYEQSYTVNNKHRYAYKSQNRSEYNHQKTQKYQEYNSPHYDFTKTQNDNVSYTLNQSNYPITPTTLNNEIYAIQKGRQLQQNISQQINTNKQLNNEYVGMDQSEQGSQGQNMNIYENKGQLYMLGYKFDPLTNNRHDYYSNGLAYYYDAYNNYLGWYYYNTSS